MMLYTAVVKISEEVIAHFQCSSVRESPSARTRSGEPCVAPLVLTENQAGSYLQ